MDLCLVVFFTADVKVRRVQDRDITAQTAWILVNTRVYVCCTLRELIFAIRTDGFFLLGINFCDFLKCPVPSIDNIFFFIENVQKKYIF